jgi:hypothetical protein
VADRTTESRTLFREKAHQAAEKAADEMIEQGNRLRRATHRENEEPTERQFPC